MNDKLKLIVKISRDLKRDNKKRGIYNNFAEGLVNGMMVSARIIKGFNSKAEIVNHVKKASYV